MVDIIVGDIILIRTPLQVFHPIVIFNLIFVIDNREVVGIRDECFRNKAMHKFESVAEIYNLIPIIITARLQHFTLSPPPPQIYSINGANTTKGTYFIEAFIPLH